MATEIIFRNYVPTRASLRTRVAKGDGVPSKDAEVHLAEAKAKARALPSENTPVLVAPKRANWDLKRDVEKRMKKLAKRTQQAIAELAADLNKDEEE
jgi:coiled-coil domain-containing protein 12